MNVDFLSFFKGFVFCMVADCFFAFTNMLVQFSLDLRNKRKENK